jgi:hypothetical protein
MLLLLPGSFGDAIERKEIVIVCSKSVVKNEDFEIGILGDYDGNRNWNADILIPISDMRELEPVSFVFLAFNISF